MPKPNKPPSPREIRGIGPPAITAAIGQKYRDSKTQKSYWLTADGWERSSVLWIEPLKERKSRWVRLAHIRGMTLEEWIFKALP